LIHETAIVDPTAVLSDGVSVGPYSVIGPDVTIGSDSQIGSHVIINGPTTIGKNNHIHQFASLGDAPQDKNYQNEPTRLEIGDNNIIREYVTINRGTSNGGGVTHVGEDNFIMAYSHIAHDCHVGNHNILANGASMAGHVHLGDYIVISGFALIHQHVSIGSYSFLAMGSAIAKDVPPYIKVTGNPAKPFGLNTEGLKRRDFSAEALSELKRAYKILYRQGNSLEDALQQLEQAEDACPEIGLMTDFIRHSRRSIIR
jgi:UDP-N-acetylglucosamine acyltransferase